SEHVRCIFLSLLLLLLHFNGSSLHTGHLGSLLPHIISGSDTFVLVLKIIEALDDLIAVLVSIIFALDPHFRVVITDEKFVNFLQSQVLGSHFIVLILSKDQGCGWCNG
ncbi:MAG: hypothetical protein ACK56F_16935, partial [bacterium]